MLAPATVQAVTVDTAPGAPAPDLQSAPAAEAPPEWRLATRVAFRFCCLYFTLYVLSTQMLGGLLPFDRVRNLGDASLMQRILSWTGTHVFHINYPYGFQSTGSGDKTVDYLLVFTLLVAAVAGAAIWSVLDRRRSHYRALHAWFRLFLRFAVGSTMLGYGMVKAIPLQMPAPGLQRLLEPFGNFSPMGVLWYSVGASKAYEMFAGFMELAGAVLLFVPRLALLGAMVTFADAVQIFTLNMTYDVPVKLFAFHLILMSLLLIAPEALRLADVIVFNRPVGRSAEPPLFRRAGAVRLAVALQILFGGYLLWQGYTGARQSWAQFGGGAPRSPLYGIWNIDTMTIDGHTRSPLVTDYARWRRVLFQSPTAITFQRMDDTFLGYGAKIDVSAKTIAVTGAPNGPVSTFTFRQPDATHLSLDGVLDGHPVHMETHLVDRNGFLLVSRGFHWIQERPFNR